MERSGRAFKDGKIPDHDHSNAGREKTLERFQDDLGPNPARIPTGNRKHWTRRMSDFGFRISD
jgi:hypothetical protein